MKTTLITLLLLFANISFAQYKNLDKLPKEERDSLLIKIAIDGINKRSEGYNLDGREIDISRVHLNYKEVLVGIKHQGKYGYRVTFMPTEREKEVFKRQKWDSKAEVLKPYIPDYFVRVYILAESGEVVRDLYIEGIDGDVIKFYPDEYLANKNNKVTKRKYITVEGHLNREIAPHIKWTEVKSPPRIYTETEIRASIGINNRDKIRALKMDSLTKANFIQNQIDSLVKIGDLVDLKNGTFKAIKNEM